MDCPKCKRPINEGNSPNVEECHEEDGEACEAYVAGKLYGWNAALAHVQNILCDDGK